MLRVIVVFSLIILGISPASGQNEANHFGFTDFELDFNSGRAEVTRHFAQHQNRGMGTISDKDGNLLFYTDGYTVFDRSHQPMPNGSSLIPLNGYSKTHQSIIIPRPGSDQIFYIFTTDPYNGQSNSGFFYSEVDLSLNSGMGDVTIKSAKLASMTTNKLSACFHSNGKDVWVMTHKARSNAFVLVSVTDQGVLLPVMEQNIGLVDQGIEGEMKFSPDSKRLAASYTSPQSGLMIFDFDASTGALSDPIEFSSVMQPALTGKLEFSSDATKLYMTGTGHPYLELGQLNLALLDTESIRSSFQVLKPSFAFGDIYQIQLAPDGKIYGTKRGGQGDKYLCAIENPNDDGDKLIIKENALYLNGGDASVAATPNFIQNYFYQTSFRVHGNCVNSTITFELTNSHNVDSVTWDFGNGSSSKLRITSTTYAISGNYTVALSVFQLGMKEVIEKQITIDPLPTFELGEARTLCDGMLISVEDTFAGYEWDTGAISNAIKVHETSW